MKKSILICDDEEGVRESLKLILEKDYALTSTMDGFGAIEKAKQKQFDLIILDIKMPKLTGVDTLKELKKVSPQIKVIIATGYKSAEIVKEVSTLGANDYIMKPFETKEVLSKITRLLK